MTKTHTHSSCVRVTETTTHGSYTAWISAATLTSHDHLSQHEGEGRDKALPEYLREAILPANQSCISFLLQSLLQTALPGPVVVLYQPFTALPLPPEQLFLTQKPLKFSPISPQFLATREVDIACKSSSISQLTRVLQQHIRTEVSWCWYIL